MICLFMLYEGEQFVAENLSLILPKFHNHVFYTNFGLMCKVAISSLLFSTIEMVSYVIQVFVFL